MLKVVAIREKYSFDIQEKELKQKTHVVAGTLGRLIDHINLLRNCLNPANSVDLKYSTRIYTLQQPYTYCLRSEEHVSAAYIYSEFDLYTVWGYNKVVSVKAK